MSTAGASAILGDIVSDCSGESVGAASSNFGISGFSSVQNCRGIANAGNGVQGDQVSNCFGTSTSGSGIAATCAFNCQGISTSGPFGINTANGTASFCRALRNGGIALTATNGIGCTVVGTGTVTATNNSLGTP